MTMYRAGVIGAGYLGSFHASKYHSLPETSLDVIVDTDPQRAALVAGQHGTRCCARYQDVLSQLDLVSIAVPTRDHFDIASDCLRAGVHVLLEKPMTERPEQAVQLNALAHASGAVLQIGHLERFNPVFTAVRDRIGRPLFIECHRLAPFKSRSTDVDVVLDLMIHDIDLLLALVPERVSQIHAAGASVLTRHADIANARIAFADGCVANLTASRISQQAMRRFRIFQADSYLALDTLNGELQHCRQREGEQAIACQNERFPPGDPLQSEIIAFVNAITQQRTPDVSGEDGLHALQIATEIRRLLAE